MEHAERDVIQKAAKAGYQTEGAMIFVPWYAGRLRPDHHAAGMSQVIGHKQMFDRTPDRSEGVYRGRGCHARRVRHPRMQHDGPIGRVRVLFDGDFWEP